jgi:hypothetical protein
LRTTGTVYARDTWNAVQRHGGSAWQQTRDFLTNHPALVQGLYYLLIGLWPVLAAESFVRATGHKLDFWLAQRMGLLLVVIGATLCLASYRREKSPEVLLIAVGSAIVMAGTGLLFVLGGTVSWVYLLDTAAELGILFLWLHVWYVENVVNKRPTASAGTPAPTPAANHPAPAAAGPAVPNGQTLLGSGRIVAGGPVRSP